MYKIQGWVEQGNTRISTSGLDSTNVAQGSFPGALVSVYIHGSSPATLATIYSDDNAIPTPLANPFTSNADGSFGFYADSGRYDLVFSGGDLLAPVSIYDVTNGAGGGVGDVVGPVGSTHFDFAQFSGTTGKIIMDSGYSPSSFVRPRGPFTAGHAIVVDSSSGGSSNIFARDGGTGLASLVTGPASAVAGNVAVFNGGSGKVIGDGGTPFGWQLTLNESGASLTNWTQTSGSWTVVSSAIQCNTGASNTRILTLTAALAQSAMVFEAEVKMSSSGGFGADNRIGLHFNYDSTTGTNGLVCQLRSTGALTPSSTGTVYVEQPNGLVAGPTITQLFNLDTFYTLRVVAIGNLFDIYFNGTYLATCLRTVSTTNGGLKYGFIGLIATNCIANYRNIKMYALSLP